MTRHHSHTLDDLPEGAAAMIHANSDRRSREMGLTAGTAVRMQRNHRSDSAVIVAAGEARLVVSRVIARAIHLAACRI
jgi:Fe2+ transport system protein FeoA